METLSKTSKQNLEAHANDTIVAFHIGRGGRYHNAGHREFIGTKPISYYVDDLFLSHENFLDIKKKIDGRKNLEELLINASDGDFEAEQRLERLGMPLGEQIYIDSNGNPVGLTVEEADGGIGCIDIDGDYDTTYTKLLSDCDTNELKTMKESPNYWGVDDVIKEYVDWMLEDEL